MRWTLVALLSLAGYWTVVLGDPGDHSFQWKFGGNFVASVLTECQTLPIRVEPLNSSTTYTGVGPYYMFAFEPGGIPTVSMIGNDPKNLSWQNTHKSGSTLMLTVADADQNIGGVASILYNVTTSADSSCLSSTNATQPSDIPVIKPNVTDTIRTCKPWGLTITGGKSPYQMVFSALNSPTITNSSMNPGDDVYTYIDRADPNQLLMASVVDADGSWGVSSPVITPVGSTDTTCKGWASSSKTTAQIQKEAQDRAAATARDNQSHRNLVIGVCVAIGVVAVLILSVGLWWFMRRRAQRGMGTWDSSQDFLPRAWNQHAHQADAHEDMQEGHVTPQPLLASTFSGKPVYTPLQNPTQDPDSVTSSSLYADRAMSSTAGGLMPNPTNPAPPLTARERKTVEARGEYGPLAADSSRTRPTASRSDTSSSFSAPTTLIGTGFGSQIQPDIIIQHHDAGVGIVQELPPPYADRSNVHN